MKILKSLSPIITIMLLLSCIEPGASYDYIQLERRGGGDKLVNLYPSGNADTLKAEVLRYNFKDTVTEVLLVKNPEAEAAFSLYHEIVKGERSMLADTASQTIRMTGTWNHYYAVKDSVKTAITNEELKETLSRFEEMVNEALQR